MADLIRLLTARFFLHFINRNMPIYGRALTNFKFKPGEESGKFHSDFVTKIYNMIGVTKKVFVAPFMENQIIGKESGTEYDNAFMKTYDEAVNWLNS